MLHLMGHEMSFVIMCFGSGQKMLLLLVLLWRPFSNVLPPFGGGALTMQKTEW